MCETSINYKFSSNENNDRTVYNNLQSQNHSHERLAKHDAVRYTW